MSWAKVQACQSHSQKDLKEICEKKILNSNQKEIPNDGGQSCN